METLIVDWLVSRNGYEQGANESYNRDYAINEARLFRFLEATQPEEMAKLLVSSSEIKRKQFLDRLQGEIAKRGIVDVLRKGIKIYPASLVMFYMTPSEENEKAKALFLENIFSVTRQLAYSNDNTKLALDLCIFINGLPVITCELKNQLTKQNVADAVKQYKTDRHPHELLFAFKRCMVHLAMDDAEVRFCTRLAGKDSWFLPFNKGCNDGAGNPVNPDGLKTDYLWKDIGHLQHTIMKKQTDLRVNFQYKIIRQLRLPSSDIKKQMEIRANFQIGEILPLKIKLHLYRCQHEHLARRRIFEPDRVKKIR